MGVCKMNGRILTERLLATTSLAALLFAAAAQDASATTSCTMVPAGGSYTNSGSVPCVSVTTTSVSVTNKAGASIGPSGSTAVSVSGTLTAGITNSGTIIGSTTGASVSAISITGLVEGGITNSGTITSTATSLLGYNHPVLSISTSSFSSGITNSGTIALTGVSPGAVVVGVSVSTFSGNIVNSGTINLAEVATGATFNYGAAVLKVSASTFAGNVINTGTIAGSITSSANTDLTLIGEQLTGSTFSGSVSNVGTISVNGVVTGSNSAIVVGLQSEFSTFLGSINNSGVIAATGSGSGSGDGCAVAVRGIQVTGTSFGATSAGGGIVNSGNIIAMATISGAAGNCCFASAKAVGIDATVSTFNGGITNSGAIIATASASNSYESSANATGVHLSFTSFAGGFNNNGIIAANATLTDSTWSSANAYGVDISGTAFTDGIRNGGTIAAFATGDGGLDVIGIRVSVDTFSGGISNSGSIFASATGGRREAVPSGISVSVGAFSGGIGNSGTIAAFASGPTGSEAATGIHVTADTFSGGIVNSGSISGTAVGGSAGLTSAYSIGIELAGGTYSGGLSNGGTIAVSATAGGTTSFVQAAGLSILASSFSGGITNNGQITATVDQSGINGNAFATGLSIRVSTFSGGITNNGSIIARVGSTTTGARAYGIYATSVFAGTIVNSGTIAGFITSGSGHGTGIALVTAHGTITNSGLIQGSTWGIDTSAGDAASTINQTGGLVSGGNATSGGAIQLSSNADTVNISGGSIAGNIVGGGAANIVNVNMGSGTFSYAGQVTNIGTLNLNSGTLLLQNMTAPGVSTVSYNQSAGSTLALEVSPAATNNHANISASGAISLVSGSVFQAYEGAFAWTPGTYTYAGVVTGDTITGNFTSAASNSPFFTATLQQGASVDNLTLTMLSPSQVPGLNGNQESVANAIIGISGGNATLDQLFTLSNPGPALTQLSGSQYTQANYQPLVESWQNFTDTLSNRLAQGGGFGGTVTASYQPGQGVQFAQADIPQVAQMSDAGHGGGLSSAPHQWGLWTRGYGLSGSAPSTATNAPYSESGAGLIIGADNQITDRIVAGVALNVATDKATVTGGGFTQSNAYQGSVYGQYTVDPNWYVNGLAGFGWQTYKSARVVTLLAPGVDNGSYDGQSYRVYGESGYALHPAFLPQAQVTPYLGLGYLHTHTGAFTETGSTSALSVQAMDSNSFTTTIGARLGATWQIGTTAFRPELRAAWQHEFLDDSATVRASFATAPGSSAFTTTGTSFGSESFLGGAGVTTTITASTELFFDYDAKVTGGYTAQSVSGGMRVQF
jgi:uncharacterized protein with beta-barrel porin domain